jgi:hypothetical protein
MTPNRLLGQLFLGVCGVAGVVCLIAGVFLSVAILEGVYWSWAWLGPVLLPAGILIIECLSMWHFHDCGADGASDHQLAPHATSSGLAALDGLALQAIIILLFANLMDGGLRLQACLYSYAGYAAGALLILARRARRLTKIDLLYLRWAWLPLIVVGVPLFVRVWKGKALL